MKKLPPCRSAHHHREATARSGPLNLKPTELRSLGLTSPSYMALATEAIPEKKGSCKENPTGNIVFAAGFATRWTTGYGRNVSDLTSILL